METPRPGVDYYTTDLGDVDQEYIEERMEPEKHDPMVVSEDVEREIDLSA